MATKSEELPAQTADAATGAAVEAAEVITDPAGSAIKEVRRLERSGAPVNRRLQRRVRRAAERAVDTTGKLLNGTVTEDLVVRGLRLVKDQARRGDLVGLAAYRSLELLHGGFGNAARSLSRFEDASEPPTRPSERRRSRARNGRGSRPSSAGATGRREPRSGAAAPRTRRSRAQAAKTA